MAVFLVFQSVIKDVLVMHTMFSSTRSQLVLLWGFHDFIYNMISGTCW